METIWTKIRADVSYSCSSSSSIDVSALTGTPTTKTKTMWQYKAKVKGYFPTLIGAGIWIRLARCRRYFTAGGRKFRFLWHRVELTIDSGLAKQRDDDNTNWLGCLTDDLKVHNFGRTGPDRMKYLRYYTSWQYLWNWKKEFVVSPSWLEGICHVNVHFHTTSNWVIIWFNTLIAGAEPWAVAVAPAELRGEQRNLTTSASDWLRDDYIWIPKQYEEARFEGYGGGKVNEEGAGNSGKSVWLSGQEMERIILVILLPKGNVGGIILFCKFVYNTNSTKEDLFASQ